MFETYFVSLYTTRSPNLDGLDELATKLGKVFESAKIHPLREGREIGGEIQIISFTGKRKTTDSSA
jgi:hypothetical protein